MTASILGRATEFIRNDVAARGDTTSRPTRSRTTACTRSAILRLVLHQLVKIGGIEHQEIGSRRRHHRRRLRRARRRIAISPKN